VAAIPGVEPPIEACAERMLDLFALPDPGFSITGLRMPAELRLVEASIRYSALPFGGPAGVILRGAIRTDVLDVLYVGLRLGENARWRTVVPVALERFQDNWRLRAHDIEKNDFPLKSYNLSRIFDARPSDARIPKGFFPATGDSAIRRYRVRLNPRMTEDQRTAVMRELGINGKGVVRLTEGEVFDFRRTYMDSDFERRDKRIVWPFVVEMERV